MISNSVFSPEGRVKRASNFVYGLIIVLSVAVAFIGAYAVSSYFYSNLTPFQRLYYPQYRSSFFKKATKDQDNYKLFTYKIVDPKIKEPKEFLWSESDLAYEPDQNGNIRFLPNGFPDVKVRLNSRGMQGKSYFYLEPRNNAVVYEALRDNIYGGSAYYQFLYLPTGFGIICFIAATLAGGSAYNGKIRRKLTGIFRRGMTLSTVKEYAKRTQEADGFYLLVKDPIPATGWFARFWMWVKEFIRPGANIYKLRIPREEESKGTLILGDTGSGKSVLINQILDCARSEARREPGVCYDPAAEFVQYHFEPCKDHILNPFDERFPNWELRDEIRTVTDLDLIAESFFPSKFLGNTPTKFFVEAAQDVFKLILERKPTNQEIVRIISDPDLIDQIVEGTEIAHKIDAKAGPQRVAVLASLADVGKLLRRIPPARADRENFSITEWADGRERHSWLFFTTTSDTRDALKPFVSAMMNILMRRLMSIPQKRRANNPAWWFIADELHTLNQLSGLPEFVTECRKHGVRPVFGTQSKNQIIEHYGQQAWALMAQAKLKIFYRCNEPEGAKWISQFIGSQELDKTQVSASLPTSESQGRDSVSFQNVTENKVLFLKEQIMGLKDLHGIWKLGTDIVPFRLMYIERIKRHQDYIPAKMQMQIKPKPIGQKRVNVQTNSPAGTEPTNPTAGTNSVRVPPVDEQKHTPEPPPPPPEYSNDIRLDF